MNQPGLEKPYLKRRFTQKEIIVGLILSLLVVIFLLVYADIKGWELPVVAYVAGLLLPVPYGFGLVVGGRFCFQLLEKMEGNFLRIPLLLFFIPLVAYTGWALFLVKGYHRVSGRG